MFQDNDSERIRQGKIIYMGGGSCLLFAPPLWFWRVWKILLAGLVLFALFGDF